MLLTAGLAQQDCKHWHKKAKHSGALVYKRMCIVLQAAVCSVCRLLVAAFAMRAAICCSSNERIKLPSV